MPKGKKRRAHDASAPASASPEAALAERVLFEDVVSWLERRKLPVPPALCPADGGSSSGSAASSGSATHRDAALQRALGWLALKERERRALLRFVEQREAQRRQAAAPAAPEERDGSSGDEEAAPAPSRPWPSELWPADVTYTNDYAWAAAVPAELRQKYRPSFAPRPPRACAKTFFARIDAAAEHPAAGQCGLFAAVALRHGERVIDYVGAVCAGEHEDKSSDYVCDFGEHSELALDAKSVGNEARFVNDYRNTGKHQNVEFKLRRDARGELRQGVYVCAKRGVAAGEELLISYGKPYWRARVGDLSEFIYRVPGS